MYYSGEIDKKDLNSDFVNFLDDEVKEDFAFLHVGLWSGAPIGEVRKNIGKSYFFLTLLFHIHLDMI